MDLLTLTAEQILRIDVENPEKLFSLEDFTAEARRLKMKWHPDRSGESDAGVVFHHITKLAEIAQDRIDNDEWKGRAAIQFLTSQNKLFRFHYLKMHQVEIGKMYIGKTTLMFVIFVVFLGYL